MSGKIIQVLRRIKTGTRAPVLGPIYLAIRVRINGSWYCPLSSHPFRRGLLEDRLC